MLFYIFLHGQRTGEPRLSFRLHVDVREGLLEERTERTRVVVRAQVAMRMGAVAGRKLCDRRLPCANRRSSDTLA